MTRIDFYILEDVAVQAMHRFACRLASKAIGGGKKVIMYTADEDGAREIDELLWHYPDRRFLPHDLADGPTSARTPLLVSWKEPPHFDGVLFNLSTEVPDFFNRFQRVVEVVVQETRDPGRERYRFYRHRGYPLYDHRMQEWETQQVTT